jgi:hypothetical protein
MEKRLGLLTLFVLCAHASLAQGGAAAGGFGGLGGGLQGGQGGGGMQGPQQRYNDRVRAIEAEIGTYLDSEEVRSILTPGEYTEWPLELKAGQVVIAGARSDAFDPALEVIDEKQKILAENDDRFPGDQRPLLLWRCPKDGKYALRARCFRDKSGGQVFVQMKVYDTLDLSEGVGELEIKNREKFLLRIPMKAGQIMSVKEEVPNWDKYVPFSFEAVVSPTGLPDAKLAQDIAAVFPHPLLAPVSGDYYVVCRPGGPGTARARATEVSAVAMPGADGRFSAPAKTGVPVLYKVAVKKGDVLNVSAWKLYPSAAIVVGAAPDVSKYSLEKPEANPFFPPVPKEDEAPEQPVLTQLPSRARDTRSVVFVAQKDATLWLACNSFGPQDTAYTLDVGPATAPLGTQGDASGSLRIGMNDYWAFEAKVGDVMTFNSTTMGFAGEVKVLDPDLQLVWHDAAVPDQERFDWSLIATKPGRYLVNVSAIGDGGGGSYTLNRQVFEAKTFAKGSPAVGDFSTGRAEVWKVTVTPDDPALLHWRSDSWNYSVSVRDENGRDIGLPRTRVDGNNMYGVLRPEKPQTYVIVLIATGERSRYTIEMLDLPGLKSGG